MLQEDIKMQNELLHHEDENNIIDLLHSEMVFPFNIKNLNYRLFLNSNEIRSFSNSEHNFLKKIKNDEDKYQIFYKNDKFWETNQIENIINIILNNIVNSTNINNPLFLHQKDDKFTLLRHDAGNAFNEEHIENFNFNVDVNKKSSLYQVIKAFRISFTLNKVSHRVSGGFILDFNWLKSLSFEDSIDMVYLFTLFKQNILNHIMPLSMDSIIEIINGVKDFKHHTHNHDDKHVHFKELTKLNTIVDFKQISFEELHTIWKKLLKQNFIDAHKHQFDEDKLNYLRDDFFFALILILCIDIYLLFELNSILTSNDKFSYLDKKQLSDNLVYPEDETKFSNEEYLNNLLHMIHNNYSHNGSIFKTPSFNLETRKKIIKQDSISLKNLKINYMLSLPSIVYSFKLTQFKNVFHFDEFLKNDQYLAIFLMILFPSSYLMQMSDKSLFPDLNLIYKYIGFLNEMDKSKFRKQIKECLCENNYYYYSFVKNDSVILLENNNYDKKSSATLNNISYYYLVGVSFVQARLNELTEIQKLSNYVEFTNDIKWKNIPYHKLIKDINDLDFDVESADLFSNEKLKPIISSMDKDYKLKENLHNEKEKVYWNDELFKRGLERSNFIVFFMVAILVGFINYFGQVYSETTDSIAVNGNIGIGGDIVGGYPGVDLYFPWIPMTISFASIAELAMLIILGYAFYRMIYFRVKLKNIDEHKTQLF